MANLWGYDVGAMSGQKNGERTLPEGCPRGRLSCTPLARISSTGDTFVCCGTPYTVQGDDIYRHCFKSETTDSMYDYSELDLIDVMEVCACAMSMKRRLEHETRRAAGLFEKECRR